MTGTSFQYALLVIMAIGLITAIYTDLRRREIEHWLNGGLALLAPAFWWATGLSLWPDVAMQIGIALLVFTIFAGLNYLGAMGGGDVKLIAVLALWFPGLTFLYLLVIMSLAGGVVTLGAVIWHKMTHQTEKLEVPYGVAIAFAGLWVIGERYFNHFA